jgi:hypothetical protein
MAKRNWAGYVPAADSWDATPSLEVAMDFSARARLVEPAAPEGRLSAPIARNATSEAARCSAK